VVSLFFKLEIWAKLFDFRVKPWLRSVKLAQDFVISELKFEIELLLVWHSAILATSDQMLELSRVSSVVIVNVTIGLCTLPRLTAF